VRTLTPAARWAATYLPIVLVSTFITYGLGALSHTSPAAAVLGDTATPADIVRMNHQFGLDRPFLAQYAHWLAGVLHGDLGRSWFTGIPVWQSVSQRLPVDLALAVAALLLSVLLGGLAGTAAAVRRGGRLDRAITVLCAAFTSVPAFVVGIGLVVVFAVVLHALPSLGYVSPLVSPGQWLLHLILPALALSLEPAVAVARQLRTSLVGELRQNYVTGAVVRGLAPGRVLGVHVLRNAAGPALTVLGNAIPALIGGAIVTETVFALPGLGQLALAGAQQRDVPVVQGVLLVTSALVVLSNLAVNAALARLRPVAGR
jgi:peptide/nickel transport system permease protein